MLGSLGSVADEPLLRAAKWRATSPLLGKELYADFKATLFFFDSHHTGLLFEQSRILLAVGHHDINPHALGQRMVSSEAGTISGSG
jgi:hypothetical protein